MSKVTEGRYERYLIFLAIVAAAISLSSCSSPSTAPTPNPPAASQVEAGTILISPTMVAPWDEVSAALRPAFVLTGDQAVTKVLPTTESINEQIESAFGASLAAGLPTTSSTSTTSVGGANPGTTSTTEKKFGTPPTLTNALPAGVTPPTTTPTSSSALGQDPALTYQAATYLLQQVQLLNQEIDNAASRSCFVPYVVKIKLAVMNFRPKLPYSAHVHINFSYNGALASNYRHGDTGKNPPLPSRELAPECQTFGVSPAVVPLLVADDMQVALRSRTAEAARQLAFGLSAIVHGVGIGANLGSLQGSLTAIANHELTSTLTIGRETESSLYALITPNNQASGQAALISQTYDVAVLLLLPRQYFGGQEDPQSPTIGITSYSQYRDAQKGALLPEIESSELLNEVKKVIAVHLTDRGLEVWKKRDTNKDFEARRLLDAVKIGSMQGFIDLVECRRWTADEAGQTTRLCEGYGKTLYLDEYHDFRPQFWAEMSRFMDEYAGKFAVFQAQLPAPIKVPSQQVVLNDDGNNPIQAVVGAVAARSTAKLAAFLNVTPFDVKAWKSQAPVTIPAQSLVLDSVAHTLTLTFPSLKKLNISCLSPPEIPAKPAKDPECPAGEAGPGSGSRPNAVVLQLVGCDPARQLCPALTDTAIDEAQSDWITRKLARVQGMQELTQKDIEFQQGKKKDSPCYVNAGDAANSTPSSQAKREWDTNRSEKVKKDCGDRLTDLQERNAAFADLISRLQTAVDSFRAQQSAQLVSTTARSAGRSVAGSSSIGPHKAWPDSWAAVKQSAAAVNLNAFLEDHASLGVSLFTTSQSTNPAKVAVSNTGVTVAYDGAGNGQLVMTLTPTPATDTMAISVSGAALKSVADSSGIAMSFDSKHGFVLPQAGVYALSLSSLDSNYPVKVSVQALKGGSNDGQALVQTYRAVVAK